MRLSELPVRLVRPLKLCEDCADELYDLAAMAEEQRLKNLQRQIYRDNARDGGPVRTYSGQKERRLALMRFMRDQDKPLGAFAIWRKAGIAGNDATIYSDLMALAASGQLECMVADGRGAPGRAKRTFRVRAK